MISPEKKFYTASDVSMLLEFSESSAYRKIHALNTELLAKGKIVISGKISKRYFDERLYI
jgi:hypothetical protein